MPFLPGAGLGGKKGVVESFIQQPEMGCPS